METNFDFRTESYGELGGVGWRRLRGQEGLARGVEVIVLDNGLLRMEVVPTRGMGIRRVRIPNGLRLGWDSPVKGPVHPQFVRLEEEGGTGWLRGFDEWLVRCGLFSNGAPCEDEVVTPVGGKRTVPLPLHGRIANLPARGVNFFLTPEGRFVLSGSIREAVVFGSALRLETSVELSPGEASFTVHDRVTNVGGKPSEFALLYHLNFGRSLLEAGSRLTAPVRWLQARDSADPEKLARALTFTAPEAGAGEEVYYLGLASDPDGQVPIVLANAAASQGCRLRYEAERLPWFTLWKYLASEAEGYVVGLEPGTNLPNPKPFERQHGRIPVLGVGESFSTRLKVDLLLDARAVGQAEAGVRSLQERLSPEIPPSGLAPENLGYTPDITY